MDGKEGAWGYVIEVHEQTIAALAPGPNLDGLSQSMLANYAIFLRAHNDSLQSHSFGLQAWIRQVITICTTSALYGEDSPFRRDPELSYAFRYVMSIPLQKSKANPEQ